MKRPNIILMNADDLGYGDIGCYGSKLNRTPTIDWMAENGVLFTDFYAASPVCSPSRGALMTGCYPPRIGFDSFEGYAVLFPGQGVGLNPEEFTLGKMFKEAGYDTMHVGKWHCGDQWEFMPLSHGFDHYYGLPYSNGMGRQRGRMEGKTPGGRDLPFPPMPLIEDDTVIEQQPDQPGLIERYVEQSTRFIRSHAKSNVPFFLYFAPMQVHRPLYAPLQFVKRSLNGDYGACVECLDWAMSVLIYELRRQDILEDTILIFTSDNGSNMLDGGSNAPLRGKKATTWEGGSRVPFVIYGPKYVAQATRCDAITSNIDLLPTFAELLGVSLPGNQIDGTSFVKLLRTPGDTKALEERPFYYYWRDQLEAVRVGKWKLHFCKGNEKVELLYDLSTDVGENINLYNEYPEVVERLDTYAEQMRKQLGDGFIGLRGDACRPIGKVENPVPLTYHKDDFPYLDPMYDRSDVG